MDIPVQNLRKLLAGSRGEVIVARCLAGAGLKVFKRERGTWTPQSTGPSSPRKSCGSTVTGAGPGEVDVEPSRRTWRPGRDNSYGAADGACASTSLFLQASVLTSRPPHTFAVRVCTVDADAEPPRRAPGAIWRPLWLRLAVTERDRHPQGCAAASPSRSAQSCLRRSKTRTLPM